MRNKIKKASVYGMFFIMILFSPSSFSIHNKLTLHFDILFPEIPFKVILDTCMKVQGDIDSLSDAKFLIKDFELLNDLIVGRLFHIRICVENIKSQEPCVHPEDIAYLITILENMLSSYTHMYINDSVKTKKGIYIVNLIRGIKLKLKTD